MKKSILVVDNEVNVAESFRFILEDRYHVDVALCGSEGLNKMNGSDYDLLIWDLHNLNGPEILSSFNKEQKVILVSESLTREQLFENAITRYPFFNKPFNPYKMLDCVDTLLNKRTEYCSELKTINKRIIGKSDGLKKALDLISKMQQCDTTVYICGDTGTGKELVAREIHFYGNRKNTPFVPVNCSAIPSNLIEAELLGYEKGSFTGAFRRGIGKFEQANKGTLFLDEVCSLSLEAQAKLLRIIEDMELVRIGSSSTVKLNVRIISASNRCLEDMVIKSEFRRDLYHRLTIFPIELPSLTERASDIGVLFEYFVEMYCRKFNKEINYIDDGVLSCLMKYCWPGNVRELKNITERMIILSENGVIDMDLLPSQIALYKSMVIERWPQRFEQLFKW